jgi:hypothetical protein
VLDRWREGGRGSAHSWPVWWGRAGAGQLPGCGIPPHGYSGKSSPEKKGQWHKTVKYTRVWNPSSRIFWDKLSWEKETVSQDCYLYQGVASLLTDILGQALLKKGTVSQDCSLYQGVASLLSSPEKKGQWNKTAIYTMVWHPSSRRLWQKLSWEKGTVTQDWYRMYNGTTVWHPSSRIFW